MTHWSKAGSGPAPNPDGEDMARDRQAIGGERLPMIAD